MSMKDYYKSINDEFEALQDRITYLIGHTHHASTGGYQESLLRSFISQYLPDNIGVARGFVVFDQRFEPDRGNNRNELIYNSNEIDILLYDKNRPVLYKDSSELVIVDPDSVKGIIEVKRNLSNNILDNTIHKLSENIWKINSLKRDNEKIYSGIFAYKVTSCSINNILNKLKLYSQGDSNAVINHLCLGNKKFIKFWEESPYYEDDYNKWRSYNFDNNLAKGYFIYNLLTYFNDVDGALWFPSESKEVNFDRDRAL